MAEVRCPVHDEVYDNSKQCPRHDASKPGHDCDVHRTPKEHEKARVLADGGKWNEKTNKAVEESSSNPELS